MSGRQKLRRVLAGIVGVAVVLGVGAAPAPAITDAAFLDAETAAVTITAYDVPEPISNATPGCTATGLLNLAPVVRIWWRLPDGAAAAGFTLAHAEFGQLNSGLLEPILSNLLSNVTTTVSGTGYLTTISGTLLANLLGGSKTLGIRLVYPGPLTPAPNPDNRWRSDWLVAVAVFGTLGAGNTCTMTVAPSA